MLEDSPRFLQLIDNPLSHPEQHTMTSTVTADTIDPPTSTDEPDPNLLSSPRPHPAYLDAQLAGESDVPINYIPGLCTLGATYDVLNGKYADSKSIRQQVIDWSKSKYTFDLSDHHR